MENEIIILCNSPQCLAEVSAGNWPNLHTKNIFTCNLAYSHFRTTGRHLNIFADAVPIIDFLTNENWQNVYNTYKYMNIEFILSVWQIGMRLNYIKTSEQFNAVIKKSPVVVPASSAISALFYLNACENFDKIHLVGYTIKEWEGIEAVKELKNKVDAFNDLFKKYQVTRKRDYVYTYSRI